MKQSTTQDQAYLKECLEFHERRMKEIDGINDECFKYHHAQAKWFKAKLQSYFRPTPSIIPTLTEVLTEPLTYSKPTPIKDFFRRALNLIRGI